jgi:predicted DNA-binding transcriptional regulator AlpA
MGAQKVSDGLAYPPRAMRAEQAAAYLSMSRSMFLKLVDEKVMPEPIKIRGMTTWDRFDLDAAYDDLKESGGLSSVEQALRKMENDDD